MLLTAIRPEVVGTLLVLLAALTISWLLPLLDVMASTRDAIVRRLGLGTSFPIFALGAAGVLIARRRFMTSWRQFRIWTGAFFLGVALLALLAFFEPPWTAGNVELRRVTAGGTLGSRLISSPLGVVVWLTAMLGAFGLLWPRAAAWFLAAAPDFAVRAAERIIAARWPQRAFAVLAPLTRRPERAEGAVLASDPVSPADAGLQQTLDPDDAISDEPTQPIAESVAPQPVQLPMSLTERRPRRSSHDGWELPSISVLQAAVEQEITKVDNEARAQLIVDALGSFGVDAKVVQISQGPTVTQFGIEPGWEVKTRTVTERDGHGKPVVERDGRPKTRTEVVSRTRVRVNQITNLGNDLALALAAPSIRIEAPVPGRSVIGIEVPNASASTVTLRSVIESPAFQRSFAKSKLTLALGKSVSGEAVAADLAKMPHLLIAGATGSGKSVCINAIVACILAHCSPEEVRFVMIDPKRVELTPFARIPHLAFSRVIVDVDEVVGTLQAVIREMEGRYRRFAAHAVRNIEGYNRLPGVFEKLPYWVVIIDELADLMMAAPYEVEKNICRLAQLARATGIHLIVATQRPSVDVVTGLIKANFPTRIAFATTSQVDSRTILDSVGAEKLLGRGDMLFMPTDAAKPRRLQGVYVSDAEIEALVSFWADERFVELRPQVFDELLDGALDESSGTDETPADPMLSKAREIAGLHSTISASLLQRRLGVGYNRASRLLDMLEEEGIIGPYPGGGGGRPVLVHDEPEPGEL